MSHEDRSKPPVGYIVQDTPKALAPAWWGPDDGESARYDESSHDAAVAACWAHRDVVRAGALREGWLACCKWLRGYPAHPDDTFADVVDAAESQAPGEGE